MASQPFDGSRQSYSQIPDVFQGRFAHFQIKEIVAHSRQAVTRSFADLWEKHHLHTSLHSSQVTRFVNLGQQLHQVSLNSPHAAALICGERQVSYEELDRSTDALARWFKVVGLKQGDRVAIHWCNSIEVIQLYFACFKAGTIAVPLNTRLKAPEIAYLLTHSGAKICFSQPELIHLCEEVKDECPALQILTSVLPDAGSDELSSLPEITPDQMAAIMYTSGTTARPKGVMHTHFSLMSSSAMMCSLGIPTPSPMLMVSQLMHVAALILVLLPGIALGNTIVLLPAFDAGSVLDLMERWKCSYLFILPAMLQFVLEEQRRLPREVSSLRLCLSGGDSVPVALQNSFQSLFGYSIHEIYGLTESVPLTSNRKRLLREGTVGCALDPVKARVVNPSGDPLPDGHVGELQVQSPGNCIGYWEDPEATAATFDGDWLRTGDLMKRDDDHFFWFAGRAKQIIVHGGSNISPQEVEEALYRHPAVFEAGVIGAPDPIYCEKVMAFVTLREGLTLEESELREWMRGQIADYKIPEQIIFLPSLPKGLTGKVQRRDLKRLIPQAS